MKNSHRKLLVNMILFCGASIFAFSQQMAVLRTIPLSPSMLLLIKRATKPTTNSNVITLQTSPGTSPLEVTRVEETYIVALKTGDHEVDLDRAVFQSTQGAEDSVIPRFAVYDAVLDGSNLHYLFINKGQILLATAHVDGSGAVSDYRQKPLPEVFDRIDTARFVKDKNGHVTLKVREPGKKTRAFQFDGSGEAVSVPDEQISSTSSQ
jgi:hypothetical protein